MLGTTEKTVKVLFQGDPSNVQRVGFAINNLEDADYQWRTINPLTDINADGELELELELSAGYGMKYINAWVEHTDGTSQFFWGSIELIRRQISMTLHDGSEETISQGIDVHFSGTLQGLESVAVAVNDRSEAAFQWTDVTSLLQGNQLDLSLMLSNGFGLKYVNIRLRFADGAEMWMWDMITFRRRQLTMTINNGDTATVSQDVAVNLTGELMGITRVGLSVNNLDDTAFEWTDISSVDPAVGIDLTTMLTPGTGDKYVTARLQYEDGSEVWLWEIIGLMQRQVDLQIDGGALETTSQDIVLDLIGDLLGLTDVGMSVNSKSESDFVWQDVSSIVQEASLQLTLTLTNGHGDKYVNVRLRFSDGNEMWLWDMITYRKPNVNIQLDGGAADTRISLITVNFFGELDGLQRVGFSINDLNDAAFEWADVTAIIQNNQLSLGLLLTSGLGDKYVTARLEYANGNEVWLWDLITRQGRTLNMLLNGGAPVASTQEITVSLSGNIEDVTDIGLSVNDRDLTSFAWQNVAGLVQNGQLDLSLTLTTGDGPKYVNAILRYADGSSQWLWKLIELQLADPSISRSFSQSAARRVRNWL